MSKSVITIKITLDSNELSRLEQEATKADYPTDDYIAYKINETLDYPSDGYEIFVNIEPIR